MGNYVPQPGDAGIHGTVIETFVDATLHFFFGGVVGLDQVQEPDEPGTAYAGPEVNIAPDGSADTSNPLRLIFIGSQFVGDRFARPGDRVLVDVVQGNYALAATNLRAEA
jgi:hypothetical protein